MSASPGRQQPLSAGGTESIEETAIVALVSGLSRPHQSGGRVIERAAIMASGGDFAAIEAWILAHDGRPEQTDSSHAGGGGLHGQRIVSAAGPGDRPRRFVLPPGAL